MAGIFERIAGAFGVGPVDMGGAVAVLQGLGLTEPEHVAKAAKGAVQVREHAAAARTAAKADDCAAAWDAVASAGRFYGLMQAHAQSAGHHIAEADEAMTEAEDAYGQAEAAVRRRCGGGRRAPAPQRHAMPVPFRPPPGFGPGAGFGPARGQAGMPAWGMADPEGMTMTMEGGRLRFSLGMKEAGHALRAGQCREVWRGIRKAGDAPWILKDTSENLGLSEADRRRTGIAEAEELGRRGRKLDVMQRVFTERCLSGDAPPGAAEGRGHGAGGGGLEY